MCVPFPLDDELCSCLAGAACASCCLAGAAQAAEEDRCRRDFYSPRRVYVQPVVVKEYYPPSHPQQGYAYARPVGKV
ncbi:hypothetical protein PF005_g33134 [Phytophthora fragariae]|uniref:Uncharacterized protein n=1 Tax=Phytophthora fragariae TaxID=53985 RepID=A0A6A3PMV1_9STRA|nr:hypothetical protein PF003_g24012 [Phytophthora fragariae]KAE8892082.1 hypothetical protein PF003_g24013 [Phytophthora fragariae]KAE8916715.1 hypothetical protein PF009_g32962 [Phytophthora fragariae]KAE8952853.1 hypothetical protein PF011_g32576 [Phytophthora fragariae]KAE9053840.1 hypothetical protein PF010_g32760 [Phytophthora fragariae]